MTDELLKSAYEGLVATWRALNKGHRSQLLDRFKVSYSFNSGNIENPEITYHDTAEIFDENGVSNFTGDVRTIYEINNLKNAWIWLEDALASDAALDEELVLSAHLVLTRGTYDDARWAKASGRERSRRATIASPMMWEPRLRRFPGLLKHWQPRFRRPCSLKAPRKML